VENKLLVVMVMVVSCDALAEWSSAGNVCSSVSLRGSWQAR